MVLMGFYSCAEKNTLTTTRFLIMEGGLQSDHILATLKYYHCPNGNDNHHREQPLLPTNHTSTLHPLPQALRPIIYLNSTQKQTTGGGAGCRRALLKGLSLYSKQQHWGIWRDSPKGTQISQQKLLGEPPAWGLVSGDGKKNERTWAHARCTGAMSSRGGNNR